MRIWGGWHGLLIHCLLILLLFRHFFFVIAFSLPCTWRAYLEWEEGSIDYWATRDVYDVYWFNLLFVFLSLFFPYPAHRSETVSFAEQEFCTAITEVFISIDVTIEGGDRLLTNTFRFNIFFLFCHSSHHCSDSSRTVLECYCLSSYQRCKSFVYYVITTHLSPALRR